MMRFALTCRHIRPELVDPKLHDMGIYDGSLRERYYGDVEESAAIVEGTSTKALPDIIMADASAT